MENRWLKLDPACMAPTITITMIVAITGLARRSVRDMFVRYGIKPLPTMGRTLRYATEDVLAAVARMPGRGNAARFGGIGLRDGVCEEYR